MTGGTPVSRHWVIALKDGAIVIDWGDDLYQDVRSGEFVKVEEREFSHHVLNEELDWLIKIDRVGSYNSLSVSFHSLPERPQKTIE